MVSETLMGTIARTLRHTPDRLLHARRRREARARLAARRPASVLVICHGNIWRSPFAAALLARELAPHGLPVTSAGGVPELLRTHRPLCPRDGESDYPARRIGSPPQHTKSVLAPQVWRVRDKRRSADARHTRCTSCRHATASFHHRRRGVLPRGGVRAVGPPRGLDPLALARRPLCEPAVDAARGAPGASDVLRARLGGATASRHRASHRGGRS